jgi:hypothetical protein
MLRSMLHIQVDSLFRISHTDPWVGGDVHRTSRTINFQVPTLWGTPCGTALRHAVPLHCQPSLQKCGAMQLQATAVDTGTLFGSRGFDALQNTRSSGNAIHGRVPDEPGQRPEVSADGGGDAPPDGNVIVARLLGGVEYGRPLTSSAPCTWPWTCTDRHGSTGLPSPDTCLAPIHSVFRLPLLASRPVVDKNSGTCK